MAEEMKVTVDTKKRVMIIEVPLDVAFKPSKSGKIIMHADGWQKVPELDGFDDHNNWSFSLMYGYKAE